MSPGTKGNSNSTNSKSEQKQNSKNKVTLKVENIVVSVDLAEKIPLEQLTEKYRDIQQKENFPGLVVKLTNPKGTILIFASGKLVITGIQLPEHIPIIIEKILKKLEQADIIITNEPTVKVENIVTRGDFHQNINLDISSLVLDRAIYEPEVFPGLIYKVLKPDPICFLIFSSGKIICTGANDESIIKREVKQLAIKLKKEDVLGHKPQQRLEKMDLDVFDLI